MAWYDDLYNWGKGIVTGVGDQLSGKNAKDVQATYDQAMGMTQQNLADLMKFYDQRRQSAQQFYAPMQQMFNRTYGSGIAGPQVPQAAGPMQTIYGGK